MSQEVFGGRMINSEVIYVPIKGTENCIYPVYVPVVVREPEVYKATGKLSEGDYEATKDNLAGIPILPIIAALAPFVPAALKGVSKLFKKKDNKNNYRKTNYYTDDDIEYSNGKMPVRFVGPGGIRKDVLPSNGYYSQRGYHGLYDKKSGSYPFNQNKGRYAGYIPTNPNIKSLKDLQELYDKYK